VHLGSAGRLGHASDEGVRVVGKNRSVAQSVTHDFLIKPSAASAAAIRAASSARRLSCQAVN
jgi:hypothetical protein